MLADEVMFHTNDPGIVATRAFRFRGESGLYAADPSRSPHNIDCINLHRSGGTIGLHKEVRRQLSENGY